MSVWRRKPWRAKHSPFVRFDRDHFALLDDYEARVTWLANQARNLVNWLRFAHDCQDPRVGCSCSGSYRFPTPVPCSKSWPKCPAQEVLDLGA